MWDEGERVKRIEIQRDSAGSIWICLVGDEGGHLAGPAHAFVKAVELLGGVLARAPDGRFREVVDLASIDARRASTVQLHC